MKPFTVYILTALILVALIGLSVAVLVSREPCHSPKPTPVVAAA